MVKEECISCLEPITNPICVSCNLKQVYSWIEMMGLSNSYKKIIKNRISKKMIYNELNSEECILCQKETLSLCSYCFFLSVSNTLRELRFSEELLQYFDASFTYRFEEEAKKQRYSSQVSVSFTPEDLD